jgi:hypothetical protein
VTGCRSIRRRPCRSGPLPSTCCDRTCTSSKKHRKTEFTPVGGMRADDGRRVASGGELRSPIGFDGTQSNAQSQERYGAAVHNGHRETAHPIVSRRGPVPLFRHIGSCALGVRGTRNAHGTPPFAHSWPSLRSGAAGWLVMQGWDAGATSPACCLPERRGSKMFLAA